MTQALQEAKQDKREELNASDVLSKPTPRTQTPSSGAWWFNKAIYGGISFLGVFIASVYAGYWARYGKGKESLKNISRGLDSVIGERASKDLIMATALSMPGNLSIIPIKIAEDNRDRIIDKINNLVGDKSSKNHLDKEDPKQSWLTLIKGRFLAWSTVFISFRAAGMLAGKNSSGEHRFDVFEKKFSEHLVCKPLGKNTHTANGKETKAFEYGRIASLDLFASAAAAAILYLGSRFFANREKNSKKNSAYQISKGDKVVTSSYTEETATATSSPTHHNRPTPQTEAGFSGMIERQQAAAETAQKDMAMA